MNNFWKDKNVLVAGGGGFIGFHVVMELIKKKSKVTIVVSPKTKTEYLKQIFGSFFYKIIVFKLDLLDLNNFLKATEKQEIVLNFAALDGGTKFKQEHAVEIFQVNTRLVHNLLESCRINNVEKVLLMSSIDVYADGCISPIKEEYGLKGELDKKNKDYFWSKRTAEITAELYHRKYDLKIAIARVGNVYGPHDETGVKRKRVIPTFIKNMLNDKEITIFGNPKISFLYVKDLVETLLKLVEKHSVCDPVNIVSGRYISLVELAKLIKKLTKSKSKIIEKNMNKTRPTFIISTEKAKKLLGLREKVDLYKGLSQTINYFRNN